MEFRLLGVDVKHDQFVITLPFKSVIGLMASLTEKLEIPPPTTMEAEEVDSETTLTSYNYNYNYDRYMFYSVQLLLVELMILRNVGV